MHLNKFLALATVSALAGLPAAAIAASDSPTSIDYAMYFNSDIRDATACAMDVENGSIVIDPAITNPGVSCPDMSSWKLFVDAVSQEFWKNWAADEQTWPAEPLAMCTEGATGPDCCAPGSLENPGYDNAENPAISCPYFPGDHLAAGKTVPTPRGQPLSKAHALNVGAVFGAVTPAQVDAIDPGRIIRQSMAEFVFRNKPMFDYVFENDFYNSDGLAKVFAANNTDIATNAPFQSQSLPGSRTRIDFPIDAVMIKSNWLLKEKAEELGIKDDPENPFIKMLVESSVTDNNAQIFEPGEHWLVAVHISSKDLPNWVWTTFEHVNNLGRCDYTGCNDSYGFTSPDEVPAGSADNFTKPHVMSDDLPIPSTIFDPGAVYAGGTIRPGLEAVLDGLGIGVTASSDPAMPSASDSAWRSYRLKGSQVDFVSAIGRPTILGNSVTEGGFVPSSSCITCHSRAHVGPDGTPSVLGVFENKVDLIGYGESAYGTPNTAWYLSSQQPPKLQALQTDFVWGFFFANALKKD